MSREKVSTEFHCRRISVIVRRSGSDKLVVDSLVLLVWGRVLFPQRDRERVSGKVSNQRFVNSCLATVANPPSDYCPHRDFVYITIIHLSGGG